MLIHINSYPGVGKLTIALALQPLIGGRVLDNHSVYNVAFALTEFKSQAFYDTVRAVRKIAYARVLDLPSTTPVILTNAHSEDSDWGNECWDDAIALAEKRGSPLFNVVLSCDPEVNAQRIQGPERIGGRKPRDPDMFPGNRMGRRLLSRGGDALLELDVSNLSAVDAATTIATWLREQGGAA